MRVQTDLHRVHGASAWHHDFSDPGHKSVVHERMRKQAVHIGQVSKLWVQRHQVMQVGRTASPVAYDKDRLGVDLSMLKLFLASE